MVIMLRQCCCGCSLETGTIILGVLNIIGGVANLITGITTAAEEGGKEFVGVGAVLSVFGAILLLVAICLIIGAQKGNPVLLVPWMVYTLVFLIVNTTLYIVLAAAFFATGIGAVVGALFIIIAVIFVLLETYFLLVVYSLYRQLKGTAPPNYA